MNDRLYSKRKNTENHIRILENEGKAGIRYTICLSNIQFMILGLICDVGWLIQCIVGISILKTSVYISLVLDLVMICVGIVYTIYLGKIHEKEIALRFQKDFSFGLVVAAGIGGIIAGIRIHSHAFLIGSLLNVMGAVPINVSFQKGIKYGIQ